MLVRIGDRKVDVLDKRCAKRSCFRLGFDKGSFTPGRGYTSYHAKELPVCMQRHLQGCPAAAICPECRTQAVEGVEMCPRCRVPVAPCDNDTEGSQSC